MRIFALMVICFVSGCPRHDALPPAANAAGACTTVADCNAGRTCGQLAACVAGVCEVEQSLDIPCP